MQLRYALTQEEAPITEPLERADAKVHLGVEHDEHDGMIDRQIAAARREAESYMGRALITQVWVMDLDCFPMGIIEVPRPPMQSVESIKYLASDGQERTLAPSRYRVDNRRKPGRIAPAFGDVWPVTRAVINAVTVRFTAGYGNDAGTVPEDIRQAIQLIVGRHYAHREDVRDGMPAAELPLGARHLLAPYRIVRV